MKKTDSIFHTASLIERLGRLLRSGEFETDLNPVQWEVLRYLAVCNRFSNSPKAVTDYLMSTKGTVSQTLNTLERKGYIEKRKREGQGRSIELLLTKEGIKQLEADPISDLEKGIASLPDKGQAELHTQLATLLQTMLEQQDFRPFGQCKSCKYFLHKFDMQNKEYPHNCGLLNLPLGENDSQKICAEQTS